MRSATIFLPWLFFFAATVPVSAQSPAIGHRVVPAGEQATVQERRPSSTAPHPLHVQPVTNDTAPVGTTPVRSDLLHREAALPAASFDEPLAPEEVGTEVGTAARKAGGGVLGFPDHYAVAADSTLLVSSEAGVLKNDIDAEGKALTVFTYNNTELEGSLSIFADGRFSYTPPDGFTGPDTFTYRMRDASNNQSEFTTVTIHVLDPEAAPLPVELTSFEAQADGDAVVLRWTTLTETNNAGFEVEQRTEDTWTQVGFAEGFGTTTVPRDYVYRIDAVAPGLNAFRLKQVDYDGGFAYSPEVEIHVQPMAFRLAANHPNPFNLSTTVTFEVPKPVPVRVVVYDVLGRRAATLVDGMVDAGRHSVVWDGRDATGQPVASGLYLYRMEAGTFSQTKRMMLIK